MNDQSKASNLDTDKFPQFAVNRGADPFNVTNHEGSENPDNHELSQVTTTPKGQRLTTHARESLLRHGFSQPFDLVDDIIENYTRKTTQKDGATVYIQRTRSRRRLYNIVIVGDAGIVTGLRNIRPQELERLGLRYGFNPNPAN
ncbi:hypothetical protein MC7420_7849 [Coleofasciculus chthonoplastes PCC 7420]|uniref:Uncharacterized protein n=1 Tax=Coleofasciculus chthonoplastes PCC 7420 TaxID=118168 RepID=B4VIE5_9CYAN|nr:hypothetical protein [Coleofasciculus chthonoplastes]EDX78111.1 hypothetical protein MC7420_7849 [Coleofasciculus chthonoplastes PCC 7420]